MSAITHTYRFTGAGEDFGPRADGMVTLHTFESAPDQNRIIDAIAGVRWQDRDDILGSYNRIVCVDGVLSCVPDDHASGGINPASQYWRPQAWLYEQLDPDMIANPNYFTLNVCVMGQRAWYDANGWPAEIVEGVALSVIDESVRIGRPVVITNHFDFQSNRSDAGKLVGLVSKRVEELLAAPPPAPEPAPEPVPSEDIIVDFGKSGHQIPKIVRILGGATLWKQPVGNDVHWIVPDGSPFYAELLLENSGRYLCRRVGQGRAWWVDLRAIDQETPYRLAEYPPRG